MCQESLRLSEQNMIETKIKGRIGRPYLITNNIGLVGESFVMDGHFGHSELQAYVEDYQELKSKVKERIEAESEDDWAAGSDTQEEIWDVAQDQFFKSIEYDSLNDYAKLAEAAYLEVEEKRLTKIGGMFKTESTNSH